VARFPLVGLSQGMVLVVGRLFGPTHVKDLMMMLDTGSSITVVDPQAVVEVGLALPSIPERRVVFTHDGPKRHQVVGVPRLRVFGHEVTDLEVALTKLPPQLSLDGVLGLNFLQYFDLRINFREEYIELN
jgi:predicted aspartyl protease